MWATVLYMSMSLDGFVAGPNEGPGKGSARPLGVAIKAVLKLRILVRSLHVSLQCRAHLYRAARLDRRMKQHSRRCPSLRGPTPTRRSFGRAREGGSRHTFNHDLVNSTDPTAQLSSVWHIPSVPRREKLHGYHPTQKPLRLIRRAILASSREGDLIFDPFCGSGTSGVASKELGRFFVGAEKEEEYAELAGCRIGAAVRGGVLREIEEARSGSDSC